MQLILYTRPGCHLCDELAAKLAPHLKRLGATLTKRNIDDNPTWRALYAVRIPVLELDGRVLVEGRPSDAELAGALAALCG